jgi:DNA invertase Pin-like site-specific DNA recombinase
LQKVIVNVHQVRRLLSRLDRRAGQLGTWTGGAGGGCRLVHRQQGRGRRLLASFVEIESGKRSDNRPQLALAMEHARLTGGTLLIAKLDRLSRDAHFLLGLQKAGVKFVAVDMPEANELVVGLMAIIAQAERQMISARTKAALAAAKARGVKLGNPRGAAHLRGLGSPAGVAAIKRKATERAEGLRATIDAVRAEGVTSANGIAGRLNEREIATPRGGRWSARTVTDVLARL